MLAFIMEGTASGLKDLIPTFDAGSMAGVAGMAYALTGIAKSFLKDKVAGKEPIVALGIGVLFAVVSKATGAGFGDTGWWSLFVNAAFGGGLSGAVHDYIGNPTLGFFGSLISGITGMFKKAADKGGDVQ